MRTSTGLSLGVRQSCDFSSTETLTNQRVHRGPIFTGYKARGTQVSRWQDRRVCSLAAELAAWLDAK